jgi:CubicO group peptidase (beta-lactamase class C family)
MKRLRTLAVTVLLAATVAACGDTERRRDVDPGADADADADRIARYLDEHWPEGPGGTVVVAREGEDRPVACEGRGLADREARRAASCDTVYDIGSVTKSFTAAAILRLEMAGALDLSDPLADHIGGLIDGPVPDDKRGITLHHLLTHTSGLPASLGGDYEPLSREEMVAGAMAATPRSRPGEAYHYSNVGYSLLAAVIETASGVGYEEYLARELFGPAGMTHTGYVLPEWEERRVAVEYDPAGTPQGRPYEHPWAGDGPYWNLRGNGGLLSTARDMHRWYRALGGDTVLDRRAKELMFTRHVREPGEGPASWYGYGWVVTAVDGTGTVRTHNGGNGWSYALNAYFPDQGTMVFWVSNHHASRDGAWDLEEDDAAFTLGLAALAAEESR